MKLISRTNVILIVIICLVPIAFLLLGNLFSSTETPSNNFSSELFFESNTSHTMNDINYIVSGDFYYSTKTDYYLKSFNPENHTESDQFRLSWGIVSSYAMDSYSGDLFFVEEGSNIINFVPNYMHSYANSPGSVLPLSTYLIHTSTVLDLATAPTFPNLLLFSTVDNSIYYTYPDDYGNLQVVLLLNNVASDGWNGEFTVDNYGYLYLAEETEGKIYRFDLNQGGDFSLFYSSPSTTLASICFDNENTLYYTSGDNCVFRLVDSAQTFTDFTNDDLIDIAIIFVGYDQDIINTSIITPKLPHFGTIFLGGDDNAYSNYQVKFSYYFADQTYKEALDDFVANHSVSDNPTVQLDLPKLEYQADYWDPQDIFLPKNGTAIDGNAVESWLTQNRYVNQADYCFNVLNFSYFDTDVKDHWFEIEAIDMDSGVNRHWFRNEFDFPWNFDAEFPYVGYTGYESSDTFLDPTAFQWYLKWRNVWDGININDGDHEFYNEDLDHFMETHDSATSQGKYAISDYIGDWLAELITVNLFWQPVNRINYSNNISLQVKVFNGVSHLGFTASDFEWTINKTAIEIALSELMPESSINIDIEFLNLDNYSSVLGIFNDSSCIVDYSPDKPPIDNYTYYDGGWIYDRLYRDYYIEDFFDLEAADLVVMGYAFILDNATFAAPGIWKGGGLFTGLGGNRRTLQLMELDRLYYPNRTNTIAIPRQGFSTVLLHETGHAIGFPHTFTDTQYTPDFTGDTMGYYGDFVRFSQVRIKTFQQFAAEQEIFTTRKLTRQYMLNHNHDSEMMDELRSHWDNLKGNYSSKFYLKTRQIAIELQQLLREITPITTPIESSSIIPLEIAEGVNSLVYVVLHVIAICAVLGICGSVYFIYK